MRPARLGVATVASGPFDPDKFTNDLRKMQGDLQGLRMILAHLVVGMGGSLTFSASEIRAMIDAEYELIWFDTKDPIAIKVQAKRGDDNTTE